MGDIHCDVQEMFISVVCLFAAVANELILNVPAKHLAERGRLLHALIWRPIHNKRSSHHLGHHGFSRRTLSPKARSSEVHA